MKQFNNGKSRKGFTLIELLIVIAVLGILVTGILVVLNPVEQTRRATDSQRASSVSQLATAITAWHTSQLAQDYTVLLASTTTPACTPDANVGCWQYVLLNAGEIKNVLTVSVPSPTNCNQIMQGNVCLATPVGNQNIAIWAILDSTAEKTRAGCNSTFPVAIVAYSSTQQKTGIGCVTLATGVPSAKNSLGAADTIFNIALK